MMIYSSRLHIICNCHDKNKMGFADTSILQNFLCSSPLFYRKLFLLGFYYIDPHIVCSHTVLVRNFNLPIEKGLWYNLSAC